jgi:hypothetical protein
MPKNNNKKTIIKVLIGFVMRKAHKLGDEMEWRMGVGWHLLERWVIKKIFMRWFHVVKWEFLRFLISGVALFIINAEIYFNLEI